MCSLPHCQCPCPRLRYSTTCNDCNRKNLLTRGSALARTLRERCARGPAPACAIWPVFPTARFGGRPPRCCQMIYAVAAVAALAVARGECLGAQRCQWHNRTSPLSAAFCVAEIDSDSARTCRGTTSFSRSLRGSFTRATGNFQEPCAQLHTACQLHHASELHHALVSSMDSSRAESQQSTSQACLLARGLGHRGRRRPRVPAAAAVSVDCSVVESLPGYARRRRHGRRRRASCQLCQLCT